MKKGNAQIFAAISAQTVNSNNMLEKSFYILIACLFSWGLLKLGVWYGYEKAAIDFDRTQSVQINIEPKSRIDYYNEFALKACLTKLQEMQQEPEPEPTESFLEGNASYYSTEGCLGCSATLTMANGEPLDDKKLTVAFNKAPLNSYVTITHLSTGKQVTAKVTDRGGFEKHGKVIDLSLATKEALGCSSTCPVRVQYE